MSISSRIIRVPMETWTPDLGGYANTGLIVAENVFPAGDQQFSDIRQLTSVDNDAGWCWGVGTHPDWKGVFYAWSDDQVPTTQTVYRWSTDGATTRNLTSATLTANPFDVTQLGTARFCAFGGDMIMVCGHGFRPQYWDADAALASAADLHDATTIANNDISAKYISTIGQRVLLGNIKNATAGTTHPDRVWWSGTNNARRFGTAATDPTLRTGYQDIPDDYGQITGLSGSNDYALIFKQRAIYRMDFGGPFDFTFKPVVVGVGLLASNSIVNVDGDVYFWSTSGPAVMRGGGSLELLASTSMTRILTSDDAAYVSLGGNQAANYFEPNHIYATHCQYSRCVIWMFTNAKYATNSVVYQIETGRYSILVNDFTDSTNHRHALAGAAMRAPTATDRWEFRRLAEVVFGLAYSNPGGDTAGIHVCEIATSGAADQVALGTTLRSSMYVVSDEIGGDRQSAKVLRVRPRVRVNYTPTLTVTVYYYDSPLAYDTPTGSTSATLAAAADDGGWISVESPYAQAFQFELSVSGQSYDAGPPVQFDRVYEIDGVDVDFEIGGKV